MATDQKRRNVVSAAAERDTSIGRQWRSGTGAGTPRSLLHLPCVLQYKDVLPVTSSCLAHMTRADWSSLLSRCEVSHLERLLFFKPARSSFWSCLTSLMLDRDCPGTRIYTEFASPGSYTPSETTLVASHPIASHFSARGRLPTLYALLTAQKSPVSTIA